MNRIVLDPIFRIIYSKLHCEWGIFHFFQLKTILKNSNLNIFRSVEYINLNLIHDMQIHAFNAFSSINIEKIIYHGYHGNIKFCLFPLPWQPLCIFQNVYYTKFRKDILWECHMLIFMKIHGLQMQKNVIDMFFIVKIEENSQTLHFYALSSILKPEVMPKYMQNWYTYII